MRRRAENSFYSLSFAGPALSPARLMAYVLALAILTFVSSSAFAQSPPDERTVEGKARIVDGDTLEIGTRRVHLYGVDAPETDQTCERGGRAWRCGMEATYAMAALLEFHWLVCRQHETDAANDMVATCRMGGPKGLSVNREIVRRGWALALQPSGSDYASAEAEAKTARVGYGRERLLPRGSGGGRTKIEKMLTERDTPIVCLPDKIENRRR